MSVIKHWSILDCRPARAESYELVVVERDGQMVIAKKTQVGQGILLNGFDTRQIMHAALDFVVHLENHSCIVLEHK